jgi:death-on-curing protein
LERISQTLTVEDILEINRRVHEINVRDGCFYNGNDNLHYRDALEYVIGVLDETFFGQPTYPTIFDKAAAIGFHIISRHVFFDGNKRTGMIAAMTYLMINGYEPSDKVTDPAKRLVDMAVAMAAGSADQDDFIRFLREFFQSVPIIKP